MTKPSYFFNLGLTPHENEEIFNRETAQAQKSLPLRRKRRYALFLENLPQLFKYRRQIENSPKYANTPIEFLSLGFAYRQLDIRHLFLLWENPSFQALCDCGNTAVVTRFCGSPLSGSFSATAVCPHCRKAFSATNRNLKSDTSFLRLARLAASFEKSSHVPVETKNASDNPQTLFEYAETHSDFEILIDTLKAIDFYAERGKTSEEAWKGWTELDRGTYFFTTGHSLNENEDFFKQETEQIKKLLPQRQTRRSKLFFENLPLLFKYRKWIESTLVPRALGEPDVRKINGNRIDLNSSDHHDWTENSELFFDSAPIDFLSLGIFRKPTLDLRHLFFLWDNPSFQTLCDCGNTAVVTRFCGSPFSARFSATAVCPHCRKAIHLSTFCACKHALKKETNFFKLYCLVNKAEKDSKIQTNGKSSPESPTLSHYFKASPLFEILIDALAYIDFWVQKGKTPEEAWNGRAKSIRDARRKIRAQPPKNEN